MYSQDFSYYRRPDTRNVTWLTPQQVDAIRLNAVVQQREPVKVRELKPQVRPVPEENVDATNILAAAPQIVAAALRTGLAETHQQVELRPHQIVKATTGKHRHGWSATRHARYRAARTGTKYRKSRYYSVRKPETVNA